MNVAVIGGTGFVGIHVIEALRRAGHEPVALARHEASAAGAPFRRADLTEPRLLEGVLAGCQAVVNAAGSLRQSIAQTFHDVHFRGVRNLVDACRAQKVRRLIHVSSLGAGATSRSAFHRSKFLGEDLVRRSLLDSTVLRPAAMFGTGDDFVRPLARLLRTLPVAPLPGRGTARLAPLGVDDFARAVVRALATPSTVGHTYDLPGPEVLTIAEVYDRVLAAIGKRRPKVGVPYLIIEPMALFLGRTLVGRFTFDQLAILEEEPPVTGTGDAPPFDAPRAHLDVETIRRIVAG